jgi:hypothetical protein
VDRDVPDRSSLSLMAENGTYSAVATEKEL